jgi:hypothetical protein
MWRIHVTDIDIAVFNDYGTSTRKVHSADLFDVVTDAHRRFSIGRHHFVSFVRPFKKAHRIRKDEI